MKYRLNCPIGFCHFAEAGQKTLRIQQWPAATHERFCKPSRSLIGLINGILARHCPHLRELQKDQK
ncbi:MAG: hypothetical protein M0Z56_06055 [Desulfobacteraceae bacterium]|nr:hypothetical protein [Desulfobacteraceae bacterium]